MNNYKIISAVTLALAAVILLALEWQVERSAVIDAREVQRQEASNRAQDLRTRIAARISEDIHVLYGLRAFIESNPNVSQEDYAKYAASVKRSHPAIRNIAAAPDLIIRYVYPYEANKAVLGLDYRKAPVEQKSGIFRAIREGKPVVAGPVTLIQGGEAIILRLPVFVDETNADRELWGIIAAPVDTKVIYEDLDLESFTADYDLALRGKDGTGYDGAIFYGDEILFSEKADSVLNTILLENGSWGMAVKPKVGWVTNYQGQGVTRITFVAIFIVFAIFWFFAVAYVKGRIDTRSQRMHVLREKTEFLEILSHEIRSPLQGVLAAQKYLLDNGIEEPMRSIVKTAQQSGDYIISLINDYLDLQRAESNSLSVYDTPVNIRAVLGNVLNIVAAGKRVQAVSLNHNVRDTVPKLLMLDEKKITQALVNIVGNAVKFTPHGYIRITVTYDELSVPPVVQISVEDTGIGIEDAELATLFDRFTRSASGESHSGSGLGLAIAKTLIDLLSGTLSVKSKLGEGTIFTLSIPTKEVIENDTLKEKSAADQSPGSHAVDFLKDANVLVADDVIVNRILLNAMLSPLVASVITVDDGQQVLDALDERTFDLIIIDLQMPKMNGIEATKLIRQNPKTRNIPIIGLTGEDASEAKDNLAATGMNALLTKPINIEPLTAEMIKVLEVSRLHRTK